MRLPFFFFHKIPVAIVPCESKVYPHEGSEQEKRKLVRDKRKSKVEKGSDESQLVRDWLSVLWTSV